MHVNTTAASTVPVACDAFHNRPASSAKTRAPPGDWRRDWWVERCCMGLVFFAFGDLSRGLGFVKGRGRATGNWRLATGDGRRATAKRRNPSGRTSQRDEHPEAVLAFSPSPVASRQSPGTQKTARLSLAVFCVLNTLTEKFSFSLLRCRT